MWWRRVAVVLGLLGAAAGAAVAGLRLVRPSASLVSELPVGHPPPALALRDDTGRSVSLATPRGGPSALVFVRSAA
jgi:hypothetical protein